MFCALCNMWLYVCREKVEREQDEQEYENDIMAEVEELQAETEEDYQKKMSEYRRQHEEWKSWKRKQVPLHMQCNRLHSHW